jgi:heme/copper-type cytochrome/quinol oxidase subunit 2
MLFDIGNGDFLAVLELPGGQDHDYTVQAGWTAQTADGSQSWLSIENMGLILAVTLLCIFCATLVVFRFARRAFAMPRSQTERP